MMIGTLRRAFVCFVVLTMAMPVRASSTAGIYRTKEGDYTLYKKENERGRMVQQIIVGPQASETFDDQNQDGVWDRWEMKHGGVTITAKSPFNGHFTRLDITERRKGGVVELGFFYEPKRGTYRMFSRSFRQYSINYLERVTIGNGGTCGDADSKTGIQTASLARAWNAILKDISSTEGAELTEWFEKQIKGSPLFIDPSCKSSPFQKSYDAMVAGMAEVMATSYRKTPDAPGGRFLQCMDQNGLGVHADIMREFFMTKFKREETTQITNSLYDQLNDTLADTSLVAPRTEVGVGVNASQIHGADGSLSDSNKRVKSATYVELKDALGAAENKQRELKRWEGMSSVRCEYRKPTDKETPFGVWNEKSDQMTMFRVLGEKVNGKTIGKDDYAKTFFHEMIHASLITNEDYTHAIADCCSQPQGYSDSSASCQKMKSITKTYETPQHYEEAMTANPDVYDRYWSFRYDLGEEFGSTELASGMMNQFFNAFENEKACFSGKEPDTGCAESDKVTARVKLEQDLAKCRQSFPAAADPAQDKCIADYNRGYAEYSRARFKTICSSYRIPGKTVDCGEMATQFANIYGSCGVTKTTSYRLPQPLWRSSRVDVALMTLFASISPASASDLCQCFNYNGALTRAQETGSVQSDPNIRDTYNRDAATGGGMHKESITSPNGVNEGGNVVASNPIPVGAGTGGGKVVSSVELSRPYLETHGRRSTLMLNTATAALNTIKIDTAQAFQAVPGPKAAASAGSRMPASDMNGPKYASLNMPSLKREPIRINDPFKASTESSGASSGGAAGSVQIGSSSGGVAQNRSSAGQGDGRNLTAQSSRGASAIGGGAMIAPQQGSAIGAQGSTGSSKPTRALAGVNATFKTEQELIQFLTGPYQVVLPRLGDTEFAKTLIDFNVQVVDHAKKVHGTRNPHVRLEFSEARRALHVVERK